MKLKVAAFAAMLMLVGVACEDVFEPVPTTTTTTVESTTSTTVEETTTTTGLIGYIRKPLPRSGWTQEQGDEFRRQYESAAGPAAVAAQRNLVDCVIDWFVDHYSPEELIDFADPELIDELEAEGIEACKEWI
mgnify:CR=1 FL=1